MEDGYLTNGERDLRDDQINNEDEKQREEFELRRGLLDAMYRISVGF